MRTDDYILPPTSLSLKECDRSVTVDWSNREECFENCTYTFEVTWKQEGDVTWKSDSTNKTSYIIKGLTPGSSYEAGVKSLCRIRELESSTVLLRFQTKQNYTLYVLCM